MHALLCNSQNTLPVIVNTESPQYAELLCAGYVPTETGTKKRLQAIYEAMWEEMTEPLDGAFTD